MDLIDIFNNIKTPNELLKFMNQNIEYGIYGNDNKVYNDSSSDEWDDACQTKWRLAGYKKI